MNNLSPTASHSTASSTYITDDSKENSSINLADQRKSDFEQKVESMYNNLAVQTIAKISQELRKDVLFIPETRKFQVLDTAESTLAGIQNLIDFALAPVESHRFMMFFTSSSENKETGLPKSCLSKSIYNWVAHVDRKDQETKNVIFHLEQGAPSLSFAMLDNELL